MRLLQYQLYFRKVWVSLSFWFSNLMECQSLNYSLRYVQFLWCHHISLSVSDSVNLGHLSLLNNWTKGRSVLFIYPKDQLLGFLKLCTSFFVSIPFISALVFISSWPLDLDLFCSYFSKSSRISKSFICTFSDSVLFPWELHTMKTTFEKKIKRNTSQKSLYATHDKGVITPHQRNVNPSCNETSACWRRLHRVAWKCLKTLLSKMIIKLKDTKKVWDHVLLLRSQ